MVVPQQGEEARFPGGQSLLLFPLPRDRGRGRYIQIATPIGRGELRDRLRAEMLVEGGVFLPQSIDQPRVHVFPGNERARRFLSELRGLPPTLRIPGLQKLEDELRLEPGPQQQEQDERGSRVRGQIVDQPIGIGRCPQGQDDVAQPDRAEHTRKIVRGDDREFVCVVRQHEESGQSQADTVHESDRRERRGHDGCGEGVGASPRHVQEHDGSDQLHQAIADRREPPISNVAEHTERANSSVERVQFDQQSRPSATSAGGVRQFGGREGVHEAGQLQRAQEEASEKIEQTSGEFDEFEERDERVESQREEPLRGQGEVLHPRVVHSRLEAREHPSFDGRREQQQRLGHHEITVPSDTYRTPTNILAREFAKDLETIRRFQLHRVRGRDMEGRLRLGRDPVGGFEREGGRGFQKAGNREVGRCGRW